MSSKPYLASEIQARAFMLQASGLSPERAMQQAGREVAQREKRRAKAASVGASTPLDGAGSLSPHHAELATVLHLLRSPLGTNLPFAAVQNYVCFLGYSGREMLAVRLSHFDPKLPSSPRSAYPRRPLARSPRPGRTSPD
jgi:hypothetical protein